MIFLTRFVLRSAASPMSPLPALLLTMVRPVAPWAISASMSSEGMPAVPNPPIMTVAPGPMSATAAAADVTTLLITASSRYVSRVVRMMRPKAPPVGDYRTFVRSANTLRKPRWGVKGDYR